MNMRKIGFVVALALGAMQLGGCTTTETASGAADTSFAPMPDLALAPVPGAKPDSPEGAASLAAQVENDTESLMAADAKPAAVVVASAAPAPVEAYAPTTAVEPAVAAIKPAIPQEAVEVAKAAPVMEAAVNGGKGARECLMRAMYFESNRSSRDGQLAVGTVVMHRVAHGAWGKSVCGVVGAKKQFAPGVMTRKMQGNTSDLAALADAILAGKRHPKLAKNVMFFHVAGMKFPYKNMRYVLVAGGNTFYYKASRKRG